MLSDPHQAEDIAQETILRAWCKSDTLSSERGSLGGWLATVARNVTLDHLRARRTRPTELIEACTDEAAWSVADHTEQTVKSALVSAALTKVTANDRAVLYHVYFADQTCTKAAAELGIPVGTVKSRLYHALRRLRLAIEEEQTWPDVCRPTEQSNEKGQEDNVHITSPATERHSRRHACSARGSRQRASGWESRRLQ